MDDNSCIAPHMPSEQADAVRSHPLRLTRLRFVGLLLALITVTSIGALASSLLVQPPQPTEQQVSEGDPERQVAPQTVATLSQSSPDKIGIPSKPVADPRFSFLLLGYGGGRHAGSYLTDSIMVAVANPEQKTLTLLSIPRDSWVPLIFDGRNTFYSKLNTAFAYAKDSSLYTNRMARYKGDQGAGIFAIDTVSRFLGIPISNYIGIDFQGFRDMIDTVGGIDVRVPESFTAQYPANDDPSIDPSWTIVRFAKGVEHMGGERALKFSRARETLDNINEGSDFARSRRQRIVMEAFKTRLLEPGGLIHLPQILAIMAKHVDTDYSITAVGQLSQLILDWKDVTIYQTALTASNYLSVATGPGGAYVLVPSAPDHSWTQIRAFARRLWEDPSIGVAMADTQIIVANDSGEPGAGTRLTEVLRKLGYRVGSPINGQVQTESYLVDRTSGKAKLLAQQLEKDLGIRFRDVAETVSGNSDELILHLGMADKSIANLTVARDEGAPSSSAGITSFQGWIPYVPPTPVPATPTESPQLQGTPNPSGSPTIPGARQAITPTATIQPATPTIPNPAPAAARPNNRGPSAKPKN